MSNQNPFYLTWKSRYYLKKNIDDFKYHMYIEDDILFTKQNFDYYIQYHQTAKNNNCYLGFIRYEQDDEGRKLFSEYGMDISQKEEIEGITFSVINGNKYSAFWILDNDEMKKFTTEYNDVFELKKLHYEGGVGLCRENAAIGPIYDMFDKSILVPTEGCLVHHLPNNYVKWRLDLPIQFK